MIPSELTIKTMEDFYRKIYVVEEVTEIQFSWNRPVSRLFGIFFLLALRTWTFCCEWGTVPFIGSVLILSDSLFHDYYIAMV